MEEKSLEYRFGAYVKAAACGCQKDYIRAISRRIECSISEDMEFEDDTFVVEEKVYERNSIFMSMEDPRLVFALNQLSQTELFVLLSRSLEKKTFTSMSRELNVSRESLGRLYQQTLIDIPKYMEDYDHGFRGCPTVRKGWCRRCKNANSRKVQSYIAATLHCKWGI